MITINIPTDKIQLYRELTNKKNINYKVVENKDGFTTVQIIKEANFELAQSIAAEL